MGQILTPGQALVPKIVTLAELRRVLMPKCHGWPWAEAAIVDLWKLGAPVPVGPGEPEKRILMPGQFRAWWGEVQQRMGIETPAQAVHAGVHNNA